MNRYSMGPRLPGTIAEGRAAHVVNLVLLHMPYLLLQ
jgi:hypothetical protein